MSESLADFVVTFNPGERLFSEGDSGKEMYFIQGGKVRIEKEIEGKTEVLAVLEKGDFFGEMALLDQCPRTASAVVEEKAELLQINIENFEKLLKGNIEIAVRMIRKYTSRLRTANERLEELVKDRHQVDKEIEEIIKVAKDPAKPSEPLLAELLVPDHAFRFQVYKEETSIGRMDPVTHIQPDVDLTPLDKERSVSRRHAKLRCAPGMYVLAEEVGVSNGTYVNGEQLKPGQPAVLHDGSELRFGQVTLKFHVIPTT